MKCCPRTFYFVIGLKRQQKSQRWEDFDPEWGSRVYQEEKSIPIDYDDFFDRVLAQGQSPKSEGSRLAIIGEPGAGKTVLLLKVREWVLIPSCGQTRKIEESFREVQQIV